VHDVAFQADGTFHVYRVASITHASAGGVQIRASDGTEIKAWQERVTVKHRYERELTFSASRIESSGSVADSCAFHITNAFSPHR